MTEPIHDMPMRPLGATGEMVSALGIGGFHIGSPSLDDAEAIRLIRTGMDQGINFLDNSWDYHEGESERRMGKALRDGYRDRAFLMTKIDGRDRAEALRQLEESLRRLDVDHVDLVQHHEIIRLEDPDRMFADDGVHAGLLQAKQEGKVRFIGFTGHKDPLVHLRTLDVAADHGQRFDTVQMPLNAMDAHFRSFEKLVLPRLVRENIGALGMKSMGGGRLLEPGVLTPLECMHYALHLPASVVIVGLDSLDKLHEACKAARTVRNVTAQAIEAIRAKAAPYARRGDYEPFKTTARYDATARNPHWLGPDR